MSPSTPIRIICACLTVAFLVGISPANGAVHTEVVTGDGDRIVLDFDFGGYESRTVSIKGQEYQEIWIPSEPVSLVKGAPGLPHVNRSVIVPDDARMTVQVLAADYYEVFARIAPSKGDLLRTIDPDDVAYEFGDVYTANDFYPGPVATLHPPYIMRDFRGQVVQINPFQYNPVTRVLRVYTDVTVEIRVAGEGQVNVLERGDRGPNPSRAFHSIYDAHFLNYNVTQRYDALDEEGDMLIICHDAWIDNMAPFVSHKAAAGIHATVVGVSTIGNTTSAIQSYIQDVYDAGNLAFVLLVGDIAEVTSPMYSGGGADPIYAKLAGNDDYPEIIIGRFSASSAAEVDTQVQRTIDYETAPANAQDWFTRGVGIGSSEGAGIGDEGQSDIVHLNEIRDWLLGAGYSVVDQIYDPGASSGQVTAAVNAGRGIINYTGHGSASSWSTTGFSTSHVNSLTNQDMLPFIVSVACNNGEFESYDECFAESWLHATYEGAPTGAVAMYASSISQSWAPPMEGQDEFNLLLTDPDNPYYSFGALCFAGSSSMMDDYGSGGVAMFNTWIIFGDPSLRVAGTIEPQTGLKVWPDTGRIVQGQAGGPFAPLSFDFTVENLDDAPLEYEVIPSRSWVTASNDRGTLPPGGSVLVTLSIEDSTRHFDNGHYESTVGFINLTDHSGDTTRTVTLNVGIPTLQHNWTFDTFPMWSMAGKWNFGMPTGGGGGPIGYPDPIGGATGDTVYGVNLAGNYSSDPGGPYYLTSDAMDVSDFAGVTLKFQRWLNTQSLPYASSSVEVSNDGTTWNELWTNSEDVTDNAWLPVEYDIASTADGQSTVYVRWGYGVYSMDATTCSGWNVDDVEIWGVPQGTARIDLTVDTGDLDWTPVSGAIAYDVVRGDVGTLHGSQGDFTLSTDACVADDVEPTSVEFTEIPVPGAGFWFLVRGVAATGPMTYQALVESQVGLRDEEINAGEPTCP